MSGKVLPRSLHSKSLERQILRGEEQHRTTVKMRHHVLTNPSPNLIKPLCFCWTLEPLLAYMVRIKSSVSRLCIIYVCSCPSYNLAALSLHGSLSILTSSLSTSFNRFRSNLPYLPSLTLSVSNGFKMLEASWSASSIFQSILIVLPCSSMFFLLASYYNS